MRVRGVSSPLTILHLAGIPLGNNMKLSYGSFIAGQLNRPPPVVSANLSGQTVVVVGANTGLGFEATKHFAKMGPRRLILACRSQSRGDAALASAYYLSLTLRSLGAAADPTFKSWQKKLGIHRPKSGLSTSPTSRPFGASQICLRKMT